MSTGILKLAADLGSFNNIPTTDALDKLRAGLVGETEPLRALGVNLSAAQVETKALAMGFKLVGGELSAAAKAQASYALIMEQTKTAQGDFANTSTGMANSMKTIKSSVENAAVALGDRLLPIVAPLISAFAEWLPGALDKAIGMFAKLGKTLTPIFEAVGRGINIFNDLKNIFQVLGTEAGFKVLWVMVKDTFDQGVAWLRSKLPGLIETLQGWGHSFVEWVIPMIPPLLAKLGELAGKLFDWLVEQVPPLVAKLGEWAREFIAWVAPMIPPLVGELLKLLGKLLDWIIEKGPPLASKLLSEWVPAFIKWVAQVAIDILPHLFDMLGTIANWVATEGIPKMAELGWKMGFAMVGGILSGLGNLERALNDAVVGAAQRALESAKSWLTNSGGGSSSATSGVGGVMGFYRGATGPTAAFGGFQDSTQRNLFNIPDAWQARMDAQKNMFARDAMMPLDPFAPFAHARTLENQSSMLRMAGAGKKRTYKPWKTFEEVEAQARQLEASTGQPAGNFTSILIPALMQAFRELKIEMDGQTVARLIGGYTAEEGNLRSRFGLSWP